MLDSHQVREPWTLPQLSEKKKSITCDFVLPGTAAVKWQTLRVTLSPKFNSESFVWRNMFKYFFLKAKIVRFRNYKPRSKKENSKKAQKNIFGSEARVKIFPISWHLALSKMTGTIWGSQSLRPTATASASLPLSTWHCLNSCCCFLNFW